MKYFPLGTTGAVVAPACRLTGMRCFCCWLPLTLIALGVTGIYLRWNSLMSCDSSFSGCYILLPESVFDGDETKFIPCHIGDPNVMLCKDDNCHEIYENTYGCYYRNGSCGSCSTTHSMVRELPDDYIGNWRSLGVLAIVVGSVWLLVMMGVCFCGQRR